MARQLAAEVERRINAVARMLVNATTQSQLLHFCSVEYGVSKQQAQNYIHRARAIVREDYSQERADFLASRIGILDKVIQQSIESGQHSNAIGATRLQAELTQHL